MTASTVATKSNISDTWIKASVLGATWAASEIILGSFLHNLHIPFKGHLLTAIGLILLITASCKWENNGLFWRSGLICALMKTMSPSAIIFGPMIAIMAEALILELSVRIFGKNVIGFIVGSVIAMSWLLFQKVFNLLLIYGFNIVKIYDNLLIYIQKQLNTQSDIFWLPLLFLLIIYAIFGVFTALLGVRIGKSLLRTSSVQLRTNKKEIPGNGRSGPGNGRSGPGNGRSGPGNGRSVKPDHFYSIVWLVFSFLALIFSLIIISRTEIIYWLPWSALLLTAWFLRYKRGLRMVMRPKFWISFGIITLLSALLITSINGSDNNWVDGLLMGFEMNMRAAIVIVGFTVLGTELYNPRIRNFMAKSSYNEAGLALELAFESLPYVISQLPDARTFLTQPGNVIRHLIRHADERIEELKQQSMAKVYLISGSISEGKTRFLQQLIDSLQSEKVNICGFTSPRLLEGKKTIGYDIEDIQTGIRYPFLREKENDQQVAIGKFVIDQDSLAKAKELLSEPNLAGSKIVIIDEVGKLELRGQGWHEDVKRLINHKNLTLVISVRDKNVEDVIREYRLENIELISVSKTDVNEITEKLKVKN